MGAYFGDQNDFCNRWNIDKRYSASSALDFQQNIYIHCQFQSIFLLICDTNDLQVKSAIICLCHYGRFHLKFSHGKSAVEQKFNAS